MTAETQSHTAAPHSAQSAMEHVCRFCREPLQHLVVDLGLSPLCENVIEPENLQRAESFFPLQAYVCHKCWLIQVDEYVGGEDIFSHYAYFSSMSSSWLAHAANYAGMITERLQLDANSQVVELASNDGYLLKNFLQKGIPCLGIEPATNVAQVAIDQGIPVVNQFFGVETAQTVVADGIRADLMIANNVLAHVPDLNDFVAGIQVLLADEGVLTVEFPHSLNMIELNQFDTIYQEHYCYLGLIPLCQVFEHHGMRIFDVEEIPTHGGSLRIYVCQQTSDRDVSDAVREILQREEDRGLTQIATYQAFARRVEETKYRLLEFLIQAKRAGKHVAGYGAPGKGNTLLNYCGIREDLLSYTVDRNPMKQGTYLPGSRIPVYAPSKIQETRPDYVLILPWNLRDEIAAQMEGIREWGGQFVVPVPELEIIK